MSWVIRINRCDVDNLWHNCLSSSPFGHFFALFLGESAFGLLSLIHDLAPNYGGVHTVLA